MPNLSAIKSPFKAGVVAIASIAALVLLWLLFGRVDAWAKALYIDSLYGQSPSLPAFALLLTAVGVMLWSLAVGILLVILCLCAKTGYESFKVRKAGRNV